MPSDKKSLGTTDVQYIWHLEPCQMWDTRVRVKTSPHKHNFLSHKSSSTQSGSFCRCTGHLANIPTPTMSAFVNFGALRLTSDSKHTRVETITMAMVWTPASTRGQLGPHVLPCQPPLWFMGGPHRSGLPCCPSGADPRSVTGLRPGVSLAPGPIKRPLKEGVRGRGYGV